MAELNALAAEPRALEGKSALIRLRREGKVPAVMYGRTTETTPISLDAKTVEQHMKRHGPGGIVELQIGVDTGAAVIKEIQRDRVTGRVLHLDLQRISMQDQITSTVPVLLVGETRHITDEGGIIEHQVTEVAVTCRADRLPSQIVVDISELQIGHAIHVGDLDLPDGVEAAQSQDTVVVAATLSAAGRGQEAAEAAEAAETTGAPASAAGEPAAE